LGKGSSSTLLADKVHVVRTPTKRREACCQVKQRPGQKEGGQTQTQTWTRTRARTQTQTRTQTDRQIHAQTENRGRRKKMTLALAKPCSAAAVHSQSLETRHSSAAVV